MLSQGKGILQGIPVSICFGSNCEMPKETGREKEMTEALIEELETKVSYLKEDSKMCTYRINYHTERRAKIQEEIRITKEKLKKIKDGSKKNS